MSIILSNKNSSISCKLCREKFRKTQLSHIETQTSPQISQHEFVREETPTLPCPKNLLCERGYHQGRCEESVRRKLTVVCDEHCDCRENRMVNGYGDESVWPGQAVRFCEEVSPREEDFLGMIRLDLDISDDNATYREIVLENFIV
ncbi:hypothetical protein QE152_g10480 [Popillia japonica]|uniref:Uncharacterized protein n=1 Tax=Popillia japonica TaxID=7064 RepID=A0AAW1LVF0_POPJA